MKVRLFFEGAGVAVLLLIASMWDFLSPYHLVIYHNPRPVSTIAGGLAMDLLAGSILFAILFSVLDRFDPQQKSLIWAIAAAWFIVRTMNVIIFFLNYYDVEGLPGRKQKALLQAVIFAAMLLLWWLSRSRFQKCAHMARVGFALVGCCILWMLPQLVILALHTPPKTLSSFIRPNLPPDPPSSNRIVWILFDELSYDQVFDHRQSDVHLPHFDQLRSQSVSFSDVQPAGYFTEVVIPSLFSGRELSGIRSSLQGDLYVREAGARRWKPFDPNATLFHDAQQLGWSTGIAGWFNPYCRILSNVLDSCYWESINPFSHRLSDQKSTLANALDLPSDLFFSHLRGPSPGNLTVSDAHTQEYKNVIHAATALMCDERIRFVFIHLPVPHPPGIYDRRTGTYNVHGTYLDNLVLSDQALDILLDTLRKTASAPRTTLIVSSDHSWRVGMWRIDAAWSKEEQHASGGNFDPRPVLLIHFPQQSTEESRHQPFAEIKTRALIDAMMQNGLQSQTDLNHWLMGH
jgi:hypothetical protein